MLKFLENRDTQHVRRGKDFMRYESNSHLPNNRQFNSPLHQDALITNDRQSYYITKKLPPIQIYNPLVQITGQIDRPEYIVKQKDVYIPRYMEEYKTKGFKKKQGIFESFQHLLNQNQSLIQGVHSDKKPLSLPAIREHQRENQREHQREHLSAVPQLSTRSKDSQTVNQSVQLSNRSKIKSVVKNSLDSKQNKFRTENKGVQVNIERDVSPKIKEFSSDFSYKFTESYQQKKEDLEEKEKQMRQLSIFDKKIKEIRQQQQLKYEKQLFK